jgi:hypothetical protein
MTYRPNGLNRHLTSISFSTSTIQILLEDHEIFSKIGNILGHKASLNKYKKVEIIPYIYIYIYSVCVCVCVCVCMCLGFWGPDGFFETGSCELFAWAGFES